MKQSLKHGFITTFVVMVCTTSVAHAAVFAEVVYGCTVLGGNCVNVRLGPGTAYTAVKTARIGTIFEVQGKVFNEGRLWYKIKHDTGLVHPDRVYGTWYIASDFVKIHTQKKVEVRSEKTPATSKYILVDISSQMLYAYEGKRLFMSARVSTGIKGTPTPRGTFTIFKKQPSRYMQGPLPGISKKYYDLPGVPWTMYFTKQGAAIHGTYWHSSFGSPHSNGCVNLPVKTAETLYAWAPVGTVVYVRQ